MCVQCDNASFEIRVAESVNVDGENYSVITNDLKDSLPMMLAGVTFGDNYAATVVIHTGSLVIDDSDAYCEALRTGDIDPEVNKSVTLPYKGDTADLEAVLDGHETMMIGLRNGIFPAWMTLEEQRRAVLYSTDSALDILFDE